MTCQDVGSGASPQSLEPHSYTAPRPDDELISTCCTVPGWLIAPLKLIRQELMSKLVRLIRHAESAANAGLATTSPDSIQLTERGHRQAQKLAATIMSPPDMIISSPFERALATALPTAKRFPHVPLETWSVEEFTYLSPSRFAGTTQSDRKPMAEAYWKAGNSTASDGPGAETFTELLKRAEITLNRLTASKAEHILIFSHGQFIRAVAWLINHGKTAGEPDFMRRFRELEAKEPLMNCAGYELTIRDGDWAVEYQLSQDGQVKFIDEFCTDQSVAPLPQAPLTREVRDAMASRSAKT